MSKLIQIQEALIKGKRDEVTKLIQEALNEGIEAKDILNNGLVAGMDIIGERWNQNKIFIPEVLIAARAMSAAMAIIEPKLVSSGIEPLGTVVIGTVKGDLHDIGKNLVAMMLKGKGFKVIDLGTNVTKEKYVEAVKNNRVDFVCMSALLTTTMVYIKEVVEEFNKENVRSNVVLACGGAPLTLDYAKEAGCDVYTKDAVSCANLFVEMIQKR